MTTFSGPYREALDCAHGVGSCISRIQASRWFMLEDRESGDESKIDRWFTALEKVGEILWNETDKLQAMLDQLPVLPKASEPVSLHADIDAPSYAHALLSLAGNVRLNFCSADGSSVQTWLRRTANTCVWEVVDDERTAEDLRKIGQKIEYEFREAFVSSRAALGSSIQPEQRGDEPQTVQLTPKELKAIHDCSDEGLQSMIERGLLRVKKINTRRYEVLESELPKGWRDLARGSRGGS